MKTPFFITGLPRTRSAWLANLFTTDTTVCFHEPRSSVTELIGGHSWLRIGVADSTLPLKFHGIRDKWPEAPWLYVEREPAAAMRSFVKFTKEHVRLLGADLRRFWDMHRTASAILRSECPNLLVVNFEQLGDPRVILSAWEHLLGETPINALRLQVIQSLHIEQDIASRMKDRQALLENFLAAP